MGTEDIIIAKVITIEDGMVDDQVTNPNHPTPSRMARRSFSASV